jgi:hypothetical protein
MHHTPGFLISSWGFAAHGRMLPVGYRVQDLLLVSSAAQEGLLPDLMFFPLPRRFSPFCT